MMAHASDMLSQVRGSGIPLCQLHVVSSPHASLPPVGVQSCDVLSFYSHSRHSKTLVIELDFGAASALSLLSASTRNTSFVQYHGCSTVYSVSRLPL